MSSSHHESILRMKQDLKHPPHALHSQLPQKISEIPFGMVRVGLVMRRDAVASNAAAPNPPLLQLNSANKPNPPSTKAPKATHAQNPDQVAPPPVLQPTTSTHHPKVTPSNPVVPAPIIIAPASSITPSSSAQSYSKAIYYPTFTRNFYPSTSPSPSPFSAPVTSSSSISQATHFPGSALFLTIFGGILGVLASFMLVRRWKRMRSGRQAKFLYPFKQPPAPSDYLKDGDVKDSPLFGGSMELPAQPSWTTFPPPTPDHDLTSPSALYGSQTQYVPSSWGWTGSHESQQAANLKGLSKGVGYAAAVATPDQHITYNVDGHYVRQYPPGYPDSPTNAYLNRYDNSSSSTTYHPHPISAMLVNNSNPESPDSFYNGTIQMATVATALSPARVRYSVSLPHISRNQETSRDYADEYNSQYHTYGFANLPPTKPLNISPSKAKLSVSADATGKGPIRRRSLKEERSNAILPNATSVSMAPATKSILKAPPPAKIANSSSKKPFASEKISKARRDAEEDHSVQPALYPPKARGKTSNSLCSAAMDPSTSLPYIRAPPSPKTPLEPLPPSNLKHSITSGGSSLALTTAPGDGHENDKRERIRRDTRALALAAGLGTPQTVHASPVPSLETGLGEVMMKSYDEDGAITPTLLESPNPANSKSEKRKSRGKDIVLPAITITRTSTNSFITDRASAMSTSDYGESNPSISASVSQISTRPPLPKSESTTDWMSLSQMALETSQPDYKSPTYSIYGLYEKHSSFIGPSPSQSHGAGKAFTLSGFYGDYHVERDAKGDELTFAEEVLAKIQY
jgi:hypothetical protein